MAETESEETAGEKGVVWDKQNEVPERWIQSVDDNVAASEPPALVMGALDRLM